MKPAPFRYHSPTSLAETLDLLASLTAEDTDARVLAGGQSIMPMLNLRLAQPEDVVDVNNVPELTGVTTSNGDLSLGAMLRQRTAERSDEVAQASPLLADALPWIGHVQIRNRGTIGGSLAHADPAAEIPTVALALDAMLTLATAEGERNVAATDFFNGYLDTAIEPGELLTRVRLPRPSPHTGTAFMEVSRRYGDFALVGLAVSLDVSDDGTIDDPRLALLGVGSTPVRASAAEDVLRGAEPGPDTFDAAATAVKEQLDPPTDLHASTEYRRHVAGVLTTRALESAVDRARPSA